MIKRHQGKPASFGLHAIMAFQNLLPHILFFYIFLLYLRLIIFCLQSFFRRSPLLEPEGKISLDHKASKAARIR